MRVDLKASGQTCCGPHSTREIQYWAIRAEPKGWEPFSRTTWKTRMWMSFPSLCRWCLRSVLMNRTPRLSRLPMTCTLKSTIWPIKLHSSDEYLERFNADETEQIEVRASEDGAGCSVCEFGCSACALWCCGSRADSKFCDPRTSELVAHFCWNFRSSGSDRPC